MINNLNILKLFFEEPSREFNVREVSRITKIAPATASKELKKLRNLNLLKYRKERILDLYKANLDDDYYKDLKIGYNIKKIRDSGLINALNEFYLKPTIVLFGSFSHGLDTENSDIDLLVVSEKTAQFKDTEPFENKLKRKPQLFIVKDIKDLKNKHLINNVLNGIKIQGKIKWI